MDSHATSSQSGGSSSVASRSGSDSSAHELVIAAAEEAEWTIQVPTDVIVVGDTDDNDASEDEFDIEIEFADEGLTGSEMQLAQELVEEFVDALNMAPNTERPQHPTHASVVRDDARNPAFSSFRSWPARNDAMSFTAGDAELSLLPVVTCFALVLVLLGLTQTTRRNRRGWYSLGYSDGDSAISNRQMVLQVGRHDDVDELYRWVDGLDEMEEARFSS
ncbi:hypothetical protein PINS_up013603 [Pythium insidiosum]|nr:hypothetical protein PINS_up013603 [Pythium insidiosum]